ncbi:pyridoxal-dependent decarboxylase, exosortase A system-associated [Aquabacterium lacunae]|uniref:Pyridoxal-dependent decarboxylase, exosortase A system-associated n=2 Tax=Aquabacterium lacunae TaxID=2528630 RepID=A0A4Q9H3P3_9BURK|nr:pyridoxal-dependent decarboxylase, exosortase A system-associated [Aquabacterium lacunae]
MRGFEVNAGQLCLGGVPLSRLAERAGQTPFFAIERLSLARRVEEVRGVLPPVFHLHYAVKANPMPALLSWLASRVDGMDVASAAELTAALNAGGAPQSISFAGPAKRDAELRQAVAAGVLLHVESLAELNRIIVVSEQLHIRARVGLRVNPDVELRTAGMRMGGAGQVFGLDAADVPEALTLAAHPALLFEGFHVYAGSQVLQAEVLLQAMHRTLDMLKAWQPMLPAPVRSLNLGGGWGIPYFAHEQALDLAPMRTGLEVIGQRVAREWPQARVVIELGRFLVGEAGIYVAQVMERKVSSGRVHVVIDGGMHHHLAASGNLGQVLRRPYPMCLGNRLHAGLPTEDVTVSGPLCTPLDTFGQAVTLPRASPGDLLVVFQSGAYGASASPAAFLSHPAAVELLV